MQGDFTHKLFVQDLTCPSVTSLNHVDHHMIWYYIIYHIIMIAWWGRSWFDDVHPVMNATFSSCLSRQKCLVILRRTDKLVQSSSYGNIDGEYYRSAIRSFRWRNWLPPPQISQYFRNDFQRSNRKLIFIAATDNVRWLKRELLVEDHNFVTDNIFFSVDLFQQSGLHSHEKGYDLALLSLCNHSIISVREKGWAIVQNGRFFHV